jgi:hypothetical protein
MVLDKSNCNNTEQKGCQYQADDYKKGLFLLLVLHSFIHESHQTSPFIPVIVTETLDRIIAKGLINLRCLSDLVLRRSKNIIRVKSNAKKLMVMDSS